MFLRSNIILAVLISANASATTFLVNNANDSGAGSLRQAISDANARPGPDQIRCDTRQIFITDSNALPVITDTVDLVGDAGLGSAPTTPGFTILGNGNSTSLLRLSAGAAGSTIRGLRIAYTATGTSCIQVDASDTSIFNCHIGVASNGRYLPPNGILVASGNGTGITSNARRFRLGQPGDTFRNVLAAPILINSYNAIIENNHFGISADGTGAVFLPGEAPPNQTHLFLNVGATRVGGTTPAQSNYFAGATRGIVCFPKPVGCDILGNVFGFLKNGTPNALSGVGITYDDLYSTQDDLSTRISSNFFHCQGSAIQIFSHANNTVPAVEITANQIGISPAGIETFPGRGIDITSSAPITCRDNILRNCASAGITLTSSTPYTATAPGLRSIPAFDTYADVSQNSITGILGGPPILLAPTPTTTANAPNDNLDPDSGPNALLNAPVLTSVYRPSTSSTLVQGSFNSLPNQTFTIYFFSDRSGVINPGPRDLLGSQTVTTAANGNATLSATLPGTSSGQLITAIATSSSLPAGPHCSPVSLPAQVPSSGRFVLTNNPISAAEGQSAILQINRINGSNGATSVRVITSPLSATATPGSDWSLTGTDLPDGTVNFAHGQTSRTITLNALQDDIDEPQTESISISLSEPSNGSSADTTPKIGNLIDDDASPTIAITPVTILEGNEGATPIATFTAALSRPCERIARQAAVVTGTGVNPTDFTDTGTPSVVSVSPSVFQIQVPIRGDNAYEPDETFSLSTTLELTTANPGVFETINSSPAIGTVLNDDTLPAQVVTFTASGVLVDEDVGTITATVQRSSGVGTVEVKVLALDINSTRGSDYLGANSTTLTFLPGVLTQSVTYTIVDDPFHEDRESFALTLVEAGGIGIGANNTFTVRIKNNDPFPSVSLADATLSEGDDFQTLNLTLNLSIASKLRSHITCSTRSDSAIADEDFKSDESVIDFPPGSTAATYSVNILGDRTFEPNESFYIDLSLAFGLQISTFSAKVTLLNDDPDHPVISFQNLPVSVPENTGNVELRIQRNGQTDIPSQFKIDVSSASTASGSSDFTLPDVVHTIPSGDTELIVPLAVLNDSIHESAESIVLELVPVDATTATGAPSTTSIEILDDDLLLTPQLLLSQPESNPILSGESRDFGTVISGTTADLTFFVSNPGTSPLTGCSATISGPDAAAFSLVATTPATLQPLAPAVQMILRFSASTAGAKTATLAYTSALGTVSIPLKANSLVLSATVDSDNDGLSDLAEYQLRELGFDYAIAQPDLVASLMSGSNAAGLFTQSQLGALHVPSPLLARNPTTGEFTLTIGVRKSSNLTSFTAFPMSAPQTLINPAGKLEFRFTSPDNKAFYLLESNP
ncbi:hypothetical protein HZ994_17875 [Akkermansiaceae bacterium]|nr:hypothetical protein HZ994_17875 [Akkermansiaceae bacterium]